MPYPDIGQKKKHGPATSYMPAKMATEWRGFRDRHLLPRQGRRGANSRRLSSGKLILRQRSVPQNPEPQGGRSGAMDCGE
jgi:hypothetical protein